MDEISVGTSGESETKVTVQMTAPQLGSGRLKVYGTPAMVALMEEAAVAAIDPNLPPHQASVGVEMALKHLAATPPGKRVWARAEVTAVDGRKVTFKVLAWDESELIGEGSHTRFIVDVGRFEERIRSKVE